MKKPILDKFISYFAPKWALERARARAITNIIEIKFRGYEGAQTKRQANWVTPSTSANSEISSGLWKLRNRSRDLIRNNGWARQGQRVIANNVVGSGIRAGIIADTEEKAEEIYKLWKAWAESTACDMQGKMNFYGIQKLIARGVFESGETLVLKKIPMNRDSSEIPLKLQIIEPDFLDTSKDVTLSEGQILQGIEFNNDDVPTGYWLFSEHPGNTFSRGALYNSTKVDASDIIHCFFVQRAGQVRGVPELAPIIVKLRDFDEYDDAQLIRQKIAACFSGFVRDVDLDLSGVPEDDDGNTILIDKIEPGIIEPLPPGKDISFADPPDAGNYSDYAKSVLRAIASGIGVSYEALTGDLSEVTYSSARIGQNEFFRNVTSWQDEILITQFCNGVFGWFLEALELKGVSTEGVSATWTTPGREFIDPNKEVKALKEAVRSGFKSPSQAIRSLGREPDEVYQEIAEDYKKFDELGIILDIDARNRDNDGEAIENIEVIETED